MLLHIYFYSVWFCFKLKTELKSFLKMDWKHRIHQKMKKEIPFPPSPFLPKASPACLPLSAASITRQPISLTAAQRQAACLASAALQRPQPARSA